ncbi:hypothetical protein [Streptomyces canus]|uniref:hypothetical protein n=1 Tax=Streptomyces canus TaxID=58343 RepID=UPI0027853C4C|nr:hypothetical protein [Streptomyces canus]MDQ0762744.1 hypothetical protein [Streptomyces canus]
MATHRRPVMDVGFDRSPEEHARRGRRRGGAADVRGGREAVPRHEDGAARPGRVGVTALGPALGTLA